MITGAFAWLWGPNAWATRALQLQRSKKGLWDAAERLVERRVTKDARDRFLASVTQVVNSTVLGIATDLQTSLADDSTERRILRLMARRDFFNQWLVSPEWRARLSYQQLMQSRMWITRVARGADLLAQPFADHVCYVEEALKARFGAAIDTDFNPALIDVIAQLADEMREGGDADREALVTYFVFTRLRDTLLATADETFREAVR